MKVFKKALFALLAAALACGFFVGCISTQLSVTYVVDGETYRVQEYDMDAKISLPTPPVKEGYTFIGWYVDEALTTPYAEGKVNKIMTLYAKFSVSTIYIVVNTVGGTKIDPIEVVPGADYTIPAAEKEGYTFLGYTYIDENGEEQEFPLEGKYPSNVGVKITAKYAINKYNVTFVGAETTEKEVEYGSVAVAPNAEKPGYTFGGWYTSKTNQTNDTKFDMNTPITQDTTLYAKYTANTYEITLTLNGGTLANDADKNVTVTYDGSYSLAEPTKVGYTFIGYEFDGKEFASNGKYTYAGDVVLSAKWEQDKYTVTFKNVDGDTEIAKVENLVYGDKLPSIPAAAPGYELGGVYAEDKTTAFDTTKGIEGNTVVYVQYDKKTFTITVNGAQQGYANPSVKYLDNYTLAIPDRGANYEFVKFITKDGEVFPIKGTYTWTEDIVVTAVWEGVGRDISFFDGDVELSALRIETEHDADLTAINLPAVPAKTGYDTDGKWYIDAEFTAEFVAEGTVTSDINLYAKYTPKSYTITVMNGSETSQVPVTFNGTYSLPELTKTGYKFDGYQLLNGQAFDREGNYTTADNIIVKVIWKEDPITVSFMVGTTETEVTALRNCTVTPIADPVKEGYKFTGWYTSQTTQTAETKINFATWTAAGQSCPCK